MLNKYGLRSLLVVVMATCYSCNAPVEYKDYMKYLADQENGLVCKKEVAGIQLKVKYLPIDYLVYSEVKNREQVLSDSIIKQMKKEYENSLTFVFTMGPGEGENFSITKVGVNNYEEFARRIETMSFNMKQYITLEVGDKAYSPELVQLENLNSPEPSKNMIVVFKDFDMKGNKVSENDLTYTYSDELFYTGISKFTFKAKDIKKVPELNFYAVQ